MIKIILIPIFLLLSATTPRISKLSTFISDIKTEGFGVTDVCLTELEIEIVYYLTKP